MNVNWQSQYHFLEDKKNPLNGPCWLIKNESADVLIGSYVMATDRSCVVFIRGSEILHHIAWIAIMDIPEPPLA